MTRELARLQETQGTAVFDIYAGCLGPIGSDMAGARQIEPLNGVRTTPDGRIFAGLLAYAPRTVLCYSSEGDLLTRIDLGEKAVGAAAAPDGGSFLLRFSDRIQLIDSSGRPVWSYRIGRDEPREQANKVVQDEHVYHGREIDQDLFFSQSLTWEPSGKHFAWSDREVVHIVRVDRLVEVASWLGRSPTWAPDGASLAYLRGEQAFIRQAPGGPESGLLPSRRFVFALEWSPCSRFLLAQEHRKCWWWTKVKPMLALDPSDCYPMIVIDRSTQASAEVGDPAWGQGPHFYWLRRQKAAPGKEM